MTDRTPLPPAKKPKTKHHADVSVNDDARYVPENWAEGAEGYEGYVNFNGDLSSAIYQRPNINGMRPDIGGYKYRPLSGDSPEYGVWVNEETHHAVIAYKGTDTMSEAVFQDTFIASGDVNKQSAFQEAYDFYRYVKADLGPEFTIDVTGHSLGGAKAMHVAAMAEKDLGKRAAPHSVSFNPGLGPNIRENVLGMDMVTQPSKDLNLIVRNKNDPVSAFFRSSKANTVTYENTAQGLNRFNPFWKLKQHSVAQFTNEKAGLASGMQNSYNGVADDAIEVGAGFQAGKKPPPYGVTKKPPPPSYGGSYQAGELIPNNNYGSMGDLVDVELGQTVEDIAVRDAALVGEMESAVAMTPFELLQAFDLSGSSWNHADYGLGDVIQNNQAWEDSGFGEIKDLNHYKEPVWDAMFEWMEPKKRKATAEAKVKEQIHNFYHQDYLPYNKNLFGDRAEYNEYLKRRMLAQAGAKENPDALHTPVWVENFNVVSRAYARQQKHDQEQEDKYAAAHPHNYRANDQYLFSSPFLGTSISTQNMGILLAQQYQILMDDDYVSTNKTTGHKYYGIDHSLFDQDGLKAIGSAVARDKAIKDYFADPKHKYVSVDGNWQSFDRAKDIPSYEAAYQSMIEKNGVKQPKPVDNSGALLPPDQKHDWDAMVKYWDKYKPTNKEVFDMTPDMRRHYQEYVKAKAEAQTNSAPNDKDKDKDKDAPVDIMLPTPQYPRLPGESDNDWRRRRYYELKEPTMNAAMRARWEEFKKTHPASYPEYHHAVPDADPSKPLAPANGTQGSSTTPAPDVSTRDKHSLPPGQPHHNGTADGDITDGEKYDPHETHEGVQGPMDDEKNNHYLNHDVNNPIHEPSESMSKSAYSQAIQRFTNNAYGNVQTMRSKGMNFARFAELSDINGSMAEHARDMLAD